MSELLTCEGLTKHYGAKTALDGVDLHIGRSTPSSAVFAP